MSDSALASLELQIGIPAQTGHVLDRVIVQAERKNVISWLTIKGVWNIGPRTSDETLGKMYGLPQYLRTVLREQETGKNKYQNKKVSFDLDFNSEPITPSPQPPNTNYMGIEIPPPFPTTIPERSEGRLTNQELKPLVESIFRENNQKFQDAVVRKVHESVDLTLRNALKVNREDAIKAAEETIEGKEDSIRQLVEEIIFKSYLNQKINNQITPETTVIPETNNSEINQQFIPKIDANYHFDTYSTKVIRSALSMSENLYVYGDTGCGKTTHLEQVCAVLNRGIVRVNPHDGITREMFLGGMKLINNETIFVEGALPIAMKNGLVFLVDEISFLPPNLTAILNPIGEKNGKLYIPETSEWITPSPGFCIFATDNTGGKGDRTGQYTGTEVQNTATLDRFAFCLKMDYLPQEKESEMLIKRFPNQNQNEIEKMLKFAKDIRNAFSRGELSITFSTRKLIKFFDQRENNFSTQEALSNTILSWLDEDDETLVKTIIDRLDLLNPTPNKNNDPILTKSWYDFTQKVNKNLVEAIKILRIIAGPDLGLKDAKDLTEQYRDGLITIQEVQERIQIGRF